MLKLDFEKAEEPEIKLPMSVGSSKKHKQKTAYAMCVGDWSSDVCSSDLQYMNHELSDVQAGF